MNISVLGYKLNVELLILIGVVYLILVGHTVGGCCNWGLLREGMENSTTSNPISSLPDASQNIPDMSAGSGSGSENMLLAQMMRQHQKYQQMMRQQNGGEGGNELPTQSNGTGSGEDPAPGGSVLGSKAKDSSTKSGDKLVTKEGFVSGGGRPAKYGGNSVNTSSWFKNSQPPAPRDPQPVPLPEGEMLFFKTTPFKPECCPNTYTTSSGCACMTGEQYNYLKLRGNNNVPYSNF